MTPEQFRVCIAATESNQDPEAWGDADHAVGMYQAHPSWVWTYAHRYQVIPSNDWDWNQWIGNILYRFYLEHEVDMEPVEVAMFYHRGHPVKRSDSDWDIKYSDRFQMAAIKHSPA